MSGKQKAVLAATITTAITSSLHAAQLQQHTAEAVPVQSLKGDGVQVYTCDQAGGTWQWRLKSPEARLSDDHGNVVGSHFAGPTWKLNDGSEVVGKMQTSTSHPGTIPGLMLVVTSNSGKGKLAEVTTVQRSETTGGLAPASGCDATHAGQEARVPYTARYTFYASGGVPDDK